MNKYQITFQTWNKIASLYQKVFMDLDIYNDTYDAFCQKITKNHPRILEIGCGPGNITKYILSKRHDFDVVAIDVAPNMINLAQKNNPTADCRVMDCRNIDELNKKFDAIICGFCMPYLSKEDCSKLIKDAAFLLEKGGQIYFSTIEGNYSKSGYEKGSTGDQCFVYYYQAAYLKKILLDNHFEKIEIIKKPFTKSNGTKEVHLVFMAEKNV